MPVYECRYPTCSIQYASDMVLPFPWYCEEHHDPAPMADNMPSSEDVPEGVGAKPFLNEYQRTLPPDAGESLEIKPDLGAFVALCSECDLDVYAAHVYYSAGTNFWHSNCLLKRFERDGTGGPPAAITERPAREAAIQTADQNRYNEQVATAHKALILLMAFHNCTEENVRDVLIRISSNCYAMGYSEGMDRK